MSKSKTHKQDEENLGIIRAQKKQIKRLLSEVKRLEKLLGFRQNNTKYKDEEFEVMVADCPSCKIGFLKDLELVGRKLKFCICGYRTKAVKI
jgi:hypothetical protein